MYLGSSNLMPKALVCACAYVWLYFMSSCRSSCCLCAMYVRFNAFGVSFFCILYVRALALFACLHFNVFVRVCMCLRVFAVCVCVCVIVFCILCVPAVCVRFNAFEVSFFPVYMNLHVLSAFLCIHLSVSLFFFHTLALFGCIHEPRFGACFDFLWGLI